MLTINGFRVHRETWDDPLEFDGKGDEVMIRAHNRKYTRDGSLLYAVDRVTDIMGDTNNQPGRVRAGSRSNAGGLQTGDVFPGSPTEPPQPWEMANRHPPFLAWEDDLADGEVVYIAPSIWEYDGGGSVVDNYIAWQAEVDRQFGERAKKIYEDAHGPMDWIFDAVSLTIQTIDSTSGIFGFRGKKGDRPIGTTRDPNDRNKPIYNPVIIELTPSRAEALLTANPSGQGNGVLELEFKDDPYLEGNYSLWVQLHRAGASQPGNILRTTNGNAELKRGEKLVSPSGRFTLWMQADGNLVLYDGVPSVQTAYWATNTWGRAPDRSPVKALMQTDGHLVLYDRQGRPVWGSGVWGSYVSPYLELQDDGNLVIYHNGRQPIWASNTVRAAVPVLN
jgi:hypothetical protein